MSEIQYLEINDVTRIIKVPTNLLLGVMEDKDVERVYFKCKKIVGDNVDLSKHQLYVKYVNALDNSSKNFDVKTPGIYHCEDVVDHGDYITFSWLLSGNVFKKGGFVAFSVLASDGETTRWNTFPAIVTVLITIPGGLQEVEERYPDIITQLLNRMDEVEAMATPEAMQGYVNTYLAAHPAEIDPELLDPKKCAPADVVGQLKEEKISKPREEDNNKLARAKNGEVEWVEYGLPTDEQTSGAITNWLNEHPEATTTVQDGSLNISKLSDNAYDIITKGVVYADNLGLDKFTNIDDANNYSSNNNDLIMNNILETGKHIVFGTGYYPFLNNINLNNHMRICGSGTKNTYLVFPNSDGIVFLRPLYYNQVTVESMTIISKYNCIGLADKDENKVAINIYETTFRDLYLKSLLSDCVLGCKDNSGNLAFDIMIDDVIVEAPNGSGISNITGLANVFSRIRDNGSIKNIFRNCSGRFVNINTTFAEAEYFLYFDYINNYSLMLTFENCNIESFSKGFIGMLNDRNVVNFRIDELICINTDFTQPSDTIMTVAPITAVDIKNIFFVNSNVIGKYPINYASDVKSGIVLTETHVPRKIISDVDVNMFIPAYNREVCVYKSIEIEDSILQRNYGVKKAQKYDECHFDLITGQRKMYELNVTSDDLGSKEYPNLVSKYSAIFPDVVNVLATIELRWLSMIIEKNGVGQIVTINNKKESTQNIVIIANNYTGGNFGFIAESNVTITPNNSASFIVINKNGYLQYRYLGY